MTIINHILIIFSVLSMPLSLLAEQPTVHMEPLHLQGARILQEQTASAAVRDYLQSWNILSSALEQNRDDMLDPDFVGTALDEFTNTIHEQIALGIHTRYLDHAHDIRIVFYSPEGLSIQLIDTVSYDEQILDNGKVLTTQNVRAHYVILLTPAEMRWRVRIMQIYQQ